MAPLAVNRIGLLKSLFSSFAILILGAVAFKAKHGTTLSATMLWVGSILLILFLVWSTKLRLFLNGVAVEFTPAGLTESEIVCARRTAYSLLA